MYTLINHISNKGEAKTKRKQGNNKRFIKYTVIAVSLGEMIASSGLIHAKSKRDLNSLFDQSTIEFPFSFLLIPCQILASAMLIDSVLQTGMIAEMVKSNCPQ